MASLTKFTRVTDKLVTIKNGVATALSILLSDKLNGVLTVEDFGAKGDGSDDTAAFSLAFSQTRPFRADGYYKVRYGIIPAANSTMLGMGTIEQTFDATEEGLPEFSWNRHDNLRVSPYPMFKVNQPNVTIGGGLNFKHNYEIAAIDTGGDNFTIDGFSAQGINSSGARSKGSSITAFNFENISVRNGKFKYIGTRPQYDSVNLKVVGGTCSGFDFGAGNVANVENVYGYEVGENFIFYFGVSEVNLNNINGRYIGLSNVQIGPHASYSGLTANGIRGFKCCADNLDINWTGTGVIALRAVISGIYSTLNGFFFGDTTKTTPDGSGIATLRNVTDYTLSGGYSYNNNGVGLYCTKAADATISDLVIKNSINSSSGIYFGDSITDVTLNNLRVTTLGTSLQLGGSMPVTGFKYSNLILSSANSSAASLPSNTYTDCQRHHNNYNGVGTVNFWFDSDNETIRYTGSGNAAYFGNLSNSAYAHIVVAATSTSPAALLDGGSIMGFTFCRFINSGTGGGLSSLNNVRLTLIKCWCWSQGAGTGLNISGGNNINLYDCDLFSLSGSAVVSNVAIYYSGRNNVNGTQSYTVAPYDASYVQRTL